MSFTLLHRDEYGTRSFQFERWHLLLVLAIVIFLSVGAALAGLAVGLDWRKSETMVGEGISLWREELYDQQQHLLAMREKTQAQLIELTTRISMLQAQSIRLEGVGQRVLAHAGLDADEFDFGVDPGIGGPQPGELEVGLPSADTVVTEQSNDFLKEMNLLTERIQKQSKQLEILETVLSNRTVDTEMFITGRPIVKGWLSSPYGMRRDPFHGKKTWHRGVDFAGKSGSDIVATGGGIVTWASKRHGYGLMVEVDHGNGLTTRYAHAKSLLVDVGDIVEKGQLIATMGSSGRSTGPHVHYEVWRDGRPINPAKFIYRKDS
ncbi:MAG: hypothetical protein CMF25_04405 [Kangiellaceae bacterium]|nr:hypothetical protein [Kangiellaceae bacterium]|tara:strand:+ start:20707 stop:21666 length:960 start_codon:yes stop_codon:yes gene_type:complete